MPPACRPLPNSEQLSPLTLPPNCPLYLVVLFQAVNLWFTVQPLPYHSAFPTSPVPRRSGPVPEFYDFVSGFVYTLYFKLYLISLPHVSKFVCLPHSLHFVVLPS